MSCVSPKLVKTRFGVTLVSCGHCMPCLIAKQSNLAFVCRIEQQEAYRRGLGCSFLTLTYNDYSIPYSSSGHRTLLKSDLQKFLKRFRKYRQLDNKPPVKFVACGEYGDKLSRPHYHLIIFGADNTECLYYARKAWDKSEKGLIQCGALRPGGIQYVLKYVTKSNTTPEIRQFYQDNSVEPPFMRHSVGFGKEWIERHAQEIVNNGYTFRSRGKLRLYPEYIRNRVERLTGVSPKPYIAAYMKKIHTDGKTLDDYLAEITYRQEQAQLARARLDNKAVAPALNPRLPRELRSYHNSDVFALVHDCIDYDDEIPF